jgi:hypothetical protein
LLWSLGAQRLPVQKGPYWLKKDAMKERRTAAPQDLTPTSVMTSRET